MIHFAAGTIGSLLIFLGFARLSGEGFSLPAGPVVIGIACASLSHYVSPWATPAVLLLVALVSAHEFRQSRAAARAVAGKQELP
jgi:hypothetical protein